MMYCNFVDLCTSMLSEISSLHVELIQKLRKEQQLKGCKTRLYIQLVAFEMYEGIFDNDGPLD